VQEEGLERLLARPEQQVRENASEALFFSHLSRGRLDVMYRMLDEGAVAPETRQVAPIVLYLVSRMGIEVPSGRYASALRPTPEQAPVDPSDFFGPGLTAFYAGAYAADRGAWTEHGAAVHRLRLYATAFLERGDSTSARFADGAARGLEGYGIWRRGRAEEALPVLQAAQRAATPLERGDLNFSMRWWIARLLMELKRPAEAEPYLRSLSVDAPSIYYELGRVYETLGRYDDARRSYELFAVAFKDADPELRPLAEEARRAASRLTSVVRE
jgi:tetratricopeptide (TPR) repeat protein